MLVRISKLLPTALPAFSSPKEVYTFLGTRCPTKADFLRTPNREFAAAFAITAPSTRHAKLLKLVGAVFLQASRDVAKKNAELQYNEANPVPIATLAEHLAEFDEAWAGMERKWLAKLSVVERKYLDNLVTDNERDAFRILRNWSQTDSPDFKVHCETLANRLGIELSSAAKIRRRFCSLGILRKTAEYVPHKFSARYEWTANREAKRRQGALILPQWNGNAGDARLRRKRAA